MYAINRMREENDFGAVIISTCFNKIRAAKVVLDVLSGSKKIEWQGQTLNPDNIVAIVGDMSSGVTKQVSVGYKCSDLLLGNKCTPVGHLDFIKEILIFLP